MTSQQARERLERVVYDAMQPKTRVYKYHVMAAADVAMLAVHVEACEKLGGKLTRTDTGWDSQVCGEDGYLCEEVKRLQGGVTIMVSADGPISEEDEAAISDLAQAALKRIEEGLQGGNA